MKISRILIATILIATSYPSALASSPCNARASQVWTQKLTVEALADGPSCAQAVVVLVIRNSKGDALWIASSKTSDIFTFTQAPPANATAMTASLKQWITRDDRLQQTGALPEWKNGADGPEAGEFPFYTNEGVTRADYTQTRKANLPMFCYVAGMESEACLVLTKDGTIIKIGSQSFPG